MNDLQVLCIKIHFEGASTSLCLSSFLSLQEIDKTLYVLRYLHRILAQAHIICGHQTSLVNMLILVECSDHLVDAVLPKIFAPPPSCAEQKQSFDVSQPEYGIRFTCLGWRKELECRREQFLILLTLINQISTIRWKKGPTSGSSSSGPASGKRRYGKISIPGASTVDGGMETRTESGERSARCDWT